MNEKPTSAYGIKPHSHADIVRVLGSLEHAYRITGGDLPLLCFYMANPGLAAAAKDAEHGVGAFAKSLREAAEDEMARKAWDAQPEDKRRTVSAVMAAMGRGRVVAKRALVRAGCLPR